ncbi:MAG TPA: biotin/lipoyl-containing protein, partial [Gaiellaceae bacterium]|nr:biotin/lipoyl-containing protein [Gaiellaceae bacterium]
MATEVKLPRLGQGMESGSIVRWLKNEGETVAKGEPLYELDTDKVTQEVEAESDGVLLKIVIADGEVDVGTTVGIIGAQDEDVSALLEGSQGGNGGAPAAAEPASAPAAEAEAETKAKEEAPVEDAPAEAAPAPTAPAPVRAAGERVKASPLARRIARERGV